MNYNFQHTEKFPKGFMIVAGFCYNGKLKMKKSQEKPNLIHSTIKIIFLEPIFEEDISALYVERN